MQLEILPDGELAVERECLRHVADALARSHVVGGHWLTEQFGRAFGDRQQSGHHFHRCRLAAAVRAEKAEDLAAADLEAHMIDGDEISEAPCESVRLDRWSFVRAWPAWPDDNLLVQRSFLFREKRDESVVEIALAGLSENFLGRALRDDLAVVHGGEPVEAARLIHVGGRNNDAHLRPALADGFDELPELPAGERIDARGGLIENEQIRIVHQRAAEADFLLHAA